LSERLELRPFLESDWEAVHGYRSDREVLRFQHRKTPYDAPECWDQLQRFRRATGSSPLTTCFLAIVRTDDAALLGECSLDKPFLGNAHFLGFLLRRDAWGFGYATEAASTLLRFGFTELGVKRVVAGCHPENLASVRVLTKVGMKASAPQAEFPGAPPGVVTRVFELTADAWFLANAEGRAGVGNSA
jgi:RimJ/RimL family protein N-acetyltransferase